MASERFLAALNEQIAREFGAAHQYVAVGNYYAAETFPRLASFFYEQADEERGHAMKMVAYMLDRNASPDIGAIGAPRQEFGDHVEPIKIALEQERKVTVRISELFEIARDTNDYESEQFLHLVPRGAGRGGGVHDRPARRRRAHARQCRCCSRSTSRATSRGRGRTAQRAANSGGANQLDEHDNGQHNAPRG